MAAKWLKPLALAGFTVKSAHCGQGLIETRGTVGDCIHMRPCSRFLLFSFLLATAMYGQENRGAILGRVTDPSGAIVPKVQIRVINVETGVAVDAATNEDGNYQVSFLPPGAYRLTAELAGFKKVEQSGIRVQTGASVTVNLSLEIGASTEAVTVKGDAPLLETSGSDLGQNVADNYIRDVGASFYRNAANFVRLAPGVTGQSMGTYTSDNQTAVSISGGGAIQGGNEWIIDGVSDTVPLSTGSVVLVPTVDSVAEMKVNTTMFDAAYGHSNGGAITITTKGGTNELHGTAYSIQALGGAVRQYLAERQERSRQAADQLPRVGLFPFRPGLYSQGL